MFDFPQKRDALYPIFAVKTSAFIRLARFYVKMDKNKLTIIDCSGSILAATLFTPSHAPLQSFGDYLRHKADAKANGRRCQRNRQVLDGASLPESRVNTPRSTEDGISPLNYERRLQQTALSKFGRGCTNCVSAVRKLVKSGELAV